MKCDNQGPIESPTRTLIAGDYVIPEGFSAEINIEGRIVVVRKKENCEEQAKRSMLRLIEAFHDVNFPTPEGFSREDLCAWVNSYKTGCAKERALSFIEFLDKNSYEGKMCVSNPECEDIVKAFVEKDWAKLVAYGNKYLRGAAEGRTAPLSSKCQEWIDAVECVVGAFHPGSKGYDMVIGSIHDLIKYLKSPCLENRLWSEDEKTRQDLIIEVLSWEGIPETKRNKFVSYLEKQKEQKPAEWTDADEKILERIINRQKFLIPVPAKGPVIVTFERREDTEAINWLKRRVTSRPEPKQEWSEEDERDIQWASDICRRISEGCDPQINRECAKCLSERLKSLRPQPNNNLRWRRATEGANLPESIIIPDGEEPRFGKCAVKNSYYIPVEELKNLPKDES